MPPRFTHPLVRSGLVGFVGLAALVVLSGCGSTPAAPAPATNAPASGAASTPSTPSTQPSSPASSAAAPAQPAGSSALTPIPGTYKTVVFPATVASVPLQKEPPRDNEILTTGNYLTAGMEKRLVFAVNSGQTEEVGVEIGLLKDPKPFDGGKYVCGGTETGTWCYAVMSDAKITLRAGGQTTPEEAATAMGDFVAAQK